MFEKFIVLSVEKATGESPSSIPRTRTIPDAEEEPVNYHFSVERNIDERQIRSLVSKNREIVDVMPSIPIRLIQPLNKTADNRPAEAWGIQAVGADRSPYTGRGVKVAVLDTGICRHPCFPTDELKITEKDFTNEGDGDMEGHGTHCAATIFGRDLGSTRVGVAHGINEVLIGKVIGTQGGDSAGIIEAINWAVGNHANIISMSLGIDFPGLVSSLVERKMRIEPATSIALEAYRKNILLFERVASTVRSQNHPALIIAAAGNESMRPDYEIAVSPPAVSEGILSVGALGIKQGKQYVAPFSNTGPAVSAPGVDILSANLKGGLISMSGTSMATPHVAGVAALWVEYLKGRRLFNIENLTGYLRTSAIADGLSSEDPKRYGTGIVQAPKR